MDVEEGAFVACGFWLVEAFALLGDRAAAISQMDAMLAACDGNLGLLSEEIDPRSGEMLGNFPQALSHLALIGAAAAISETRERVPQSAVRAP
jgi:GH15 family glucan-1,4-alpha-glucosidase